MIRPVEGVTIRRPPETACRQDPTSHAGRTHEARRDKSGRVHGALMEQSGRKRARTVANRPTAKTARTSRKRGLRLPLVARTTKW